MKDVLIRSVVATVLFFVLTWVGMEFVLDDRTPLKSALVMAGIYFAMVFIQYNFAAKRNKKEE